MSDLDGGYVFIGRKGDLTIYGTHIQFESVNDPECNAMYIRNENRRNDRGGCRAVVIPEGDFWKFRPEDKDRGRHFDIKMMVRALANYSIALYSFDVPAYRHRIHDAILEFLPDVLKMKPLPGETWEQYHRRLARQGITVFRNGQAVN